MGDSGGTAASTGQNRIYIKEYMLKTVKLQNIYKVNVSMFTIRVVEMQVRSINVNSRENKIMIVRV